MSESSSQFTGELGIHYPLHVLNRYSLPELLDLAERARQSLEPFGFTRVWTNDNLDYRSVLASSAAILARLPVKLGTAVTVPYFRNPIDLAMAFATMAEYFHLNAQHYALRFRAPAPIHLYYGPSLLKPAVLDLVARHFDGVILQTLYGIDDMEASLSRLDKARSRFHPNAPLRKTMLINASVSRDAQAARQHAKRFVSHIASGWPDETLKGKGIDPKAIQAVRQAYADNRGVDYASSLTPDEAVDRLIIAGNAEQCVERLRELFSVAVQHQFSEIVIGVPLGPDVPEVIDLWGKEILPALR